MVRERTANALKLKGSASSILALSAKLCGFSQITVIDEFAPIYAAMTLDEGVSVAGTVRRSHKVWRWTAWGLRSPL